MKYLWWIAILLLVWFGGASASLPDGENVEEQEMGLRFLELAWADEIYSYAHYEPNVDGVFQRGTRAYVYMEIAGFESRFGEEEKQFLTDVTIDVELYSRIGLRLFRESEIVSYTYWDASEPESLWFYIWVDIPAWAPRSTYTASVTIRDRIGDEVLVEEETLLVQ